LTSIGAAATVYARMAHGSGDVAPVRAPQRIDDREMARQSGSQFATKEQEQQVRRQVPHLRAVPVSVVEQPIVDRHSVEPRTRRPQPFVPFLAQQIAQEGLPDSASEHTLGQDRAIRDKHEAVTDAYLLASDDEARILGPVRPRELVI
jgi:hypothetical protein